MIPIGGWRWPAVAGFSFLAGAVLIGSGVGRLRYDARSVLAFSGGADDVARQLKIFRSEDVRRKIANAVARPESIVAVDRVSGQPLQIAITGHAQWPGDVLQLLQAAGKICVEQSLAISTQEMNKELGGLRQQKTEAETRLNLIMQERQAALSSVPRRPQAPRADTAAKIRALETRRALLIERYPNHTDIALIARQIQALQSQKLSRRSALPPGRILELDRQLNGDKVRVDYFSRRVQAVTRAARALKPAWKVLLPPQKPKWPSRVVGWPILSGVLAAVFLLGAVVFNGKSRVRRETFPDGLWRHEPPPAPVEAAEPVAAGEPPAPALPPESVGAPVPLTGMPLHPKGVGAPVELIVIPVEPTAVAAPDREETLPSDPLTEKAAALYQQWIDVAKVLYSPAPQAPQGVLDKVWPLLQESNDFLPQGHDVLARYLARTVAPGDLPAHVARTILMTLTAAQQAAVSPEHSLAMALAALFHDLAVVPRPREVQDAVGSDIGRLSASVLRRIPGLQPALRSMVEDILVGMDEFKLDTWQNTANGSNLEPLSKVLREIDRFEKVMQKQRLRLDRQITHRKAV